MITKSSKEEANTMSNLSDIPEDVLQHHIAPHLDQPLLLKLTTHNTKLEEIFIERAMEDPYQSLILATRRSKQHLFVKILDKSKYDPPKERLRNLFSLAIRRGAPIIIEKIMVRYHHMLKETGPIHWYFGGHHQRQKSFIYALVGQRDIIRVIVEKNISYQSIISDLTETPDLVVKYLQKIIDTYGYLHSPIYREVWHDVCKSLTRNPKRYLELPGFSELVVYLTTIKDRVREMFYFDL